MQKIVENEMQISCHVREDYVHISKIKRNEDYVHV